MFKRILIGVVVALVIIQFIRPEKNLSDDQTHSITMKYPVSGEVKELLRVACNDCHSNKTAYPWYVNVQPVAWFLDNHVQEGKRELNFSTFTKLPVAVQNHKFDEIIKMIQEKEMPLKSYTFFGLHKEANLSDHQRQVLTSWARQQMTMLQSEYPVDSLKIEGR
ncbi:heme-binding domain-containing protein [Dyadobacter psychrophilus]|uniref:Haem-binding domain-containing protein n=1 Tax=Dyadobacter psychrophilus TaxID=651661 RepID=A0A1T5B709_9BACT|nr:heme-binding domain-containing protein [Dyadobacter psychrophilus]SKB43062.1 Haem-binding domain-containing protein [Dyadobacter psychrophilus]